MKLSEIANPHIKIKQQWLDSMRIRDYTIRPNGIVDVNGDVDLRKVQGTTFPVQFGTVRGDFNCSYTEITSLQGAPSIVGGDFYCSSTNITSLQGAPASIGGDFYCAGTKITSLQGAPSSVGCNFNCSYTEITSLQGAPTSVGGGFHCSSTNITSLQGAPASIGGDFYCYNTDITSLQGIHKIIKQINGSFNGGPEVTHVLGLLLIKRITKINIDRDGPIDTIMNKYLKSRDIIAAQDELIDAGFKEQAKL